MVPIKREHDPEHNITHSDIRYDNGVMMVIVRWSKTNQFLEKEQTIPIVGNNHNPVCPVRWILQMTEQVPAGANHNLFSFWDKDKLVPITYRDLMSSMRKWLDMIGLRGMSFSSHSMRHGSTTHAHKAHFSEKMLQAWGDWCSDSYKKYIEVDMQARVNAWFKFNNTK